MLRIVTCLAKSLSRTLTRRRNEVAARAYVEGFLYGYKAYERTATAIKIKPSPEIPAITPEDIRRFNETVTDPERKWITL